MYEVRFHGRGGQGAVMAAQTLAEAAVIEGRHAHAFPFFGAERRGAPVMAFARIDEEKISIKSQVYEPDLLVVLDESLLDIEPVAKGLKPDGKAVINTRKLPTELDLGLEVECATVNATAIALEFLKAPIVNTAILGAMVRMTDLVSMDSMRQAIENRFGDKFGEAAARANVAAAASAFQQAIVGRCKGKRPLVAEEGMAAGMEGHAHRDHALAREHRRGGGGAGRRPPEPDRELEGADPPVRQGEVRPLPALLVLLP